MTKLFPATTLVWLLAIFPGSSAVGQGRSDSTVKVDGNKVIQGNEVFRTNLYDLEYVGQLKGARKKPFLIMAGRQCDSCEVNNAIYIHSPSDGPMKKEHVQKKYNLPGEINDYQTRELIYVARAFWGEVLPGRYGVIWYQKELKNLLWVPSVYFAELQNDRIVDGFVKTELKTTLVQVEKKKAWEIKGEPMSSEP